MATLARMHAATERLREGRRVFSSSGPVSAYKVAHNQKQRLASDHPLVLAVPAADDRPNRNSSQQPQTINLLEASVGPDLRWDLTRINHVMRTVSKHGAPTYLFSGISDNDPQAFVAVTLDSRTPADELQHLEDVLRHVCQFHIAESKPMQVPGPDQVVANIGKGLMKMLLGGGSSSSKQQQQQQQAPQADSRSSGRQADYGREEARQQAMRGSPEAERREYLASLEHRGAPREAGEVVPTAPVLPRESGRAGMGTSERDADARIAALKAELRGEAPPSAPDVTASRRDQAAAARSSAHPAIPDALSYEQQQQQQPWQQHAPGTLSNPFTDGSSNRAPQADLGLKPPGQAYEDYLQHDTAEEWGGSSARHHASSTEPQRYAAPPSGPAASSGGYSRAMADWDSRLDSAAAAPGLAQGRGSATGSGSGSSEQQRHSSRVRYATGARESWEEWQRTQQGAAGRAGGAQRYTTSDADRDGGWGSSSGQQPQYAGAGGGEVGRSQQQKQQQGGRGGGGGGGGAPDWLEALGKVFAGGASSSGHAYGYAPDL